MKVHVKNVRAPLAFLLTSSRFRVSADSYSNQTSPGSATNQTNEKITTPRRKPENQSLSQDALISKLPARDQVIEKFRSSNAPVLQSWVTGSNPEHETDFPIAFRWLPQELQVNDGTASHIMPWPFPFISSSIQCKRPSYHSIQHRHGDSAVKQSKSLDDAFSSLVTLQKNKQLAAS